MRISLRLILSLVVATSAVVFVSAGYQARQEEIRLQEELDKRATVLAAGLREAIEPAIAGDRKEELQRLVGTVRKPRAPGRRGGVRHRWPSPGRHQQSSAGVSDAARRRQEGGPVGRGAQRPGQGGSTPLASPCPSGSRRRGSRGRPAPRPRRRLHPRPGGQGLAGELPAPLLPRAGDRAHHPPDRPLEPAPAHGENRGLDETHPRRGTGRADRPSAGGSLRPVDP